MEEAVKNQRRKEGPEQHGNRNEQDEGAPGLRDYAPGYYGAYCRDLDGNKLHVFYIQAVTD